MIYVDSFDLLGLEVKQIPCITGNGSPTNSTIGAVGMLYMDISSSDRELWKCTDVNDNNYVWTKLVDLPNVPTKVSELENDSKYLTENEVKTYIDESILGGAW